MKKTFFCFGLIFLPYVLFSQNNCFVPDATIWNNTWQSCQVSPNPNPARGTSHWIRYDFGDTYKLYRTRLWNHNKSSELSIGAKDIAVDYSLDGSTWISIGTYRLPKAKGKAIYEGFAGPDFAGVDARYIVITILSNWGHNSCSGLAEVKFLLAPQTGEFECDNEILAIDDDPILTDTYSAQSTITSIGNVDMINHVIFKAGECIELNAGFEVSLGNTLCAEIKECILKITP